MIYQFNSKLRRAIFSYGTPEDEEHRQIFEGILSHYAADARFHGSEFFSRFGRLVLARITELPLPSVRFRSYFLAHIFLELLLDRVLLKHSPQLCVKFYSDLESVNPEVAASYFLHIGKTEVFSEFFNNFNRFLDTRYLHYLDDNEMFVRTLLRIYRKINPAYPSREEAKVLMALTDELESEHRQALTGIFDAMSSHPAGA